MEIMESKVSKNKPLAMINQSRDKRIEIIVRILTLTAIVVFWQIAAKRINIPLLWPSLPSVLNGMKKSITDPEVLKNLRITLSRVLKGWGFALAIGIPVGMLMGLSKHFRTVFSGIINALRQIPMMAWVPLTIIWFGIGDGPTLFLIALNGVFQVIFNTANGVANIPKDFYNAARSMGASSFSIFKNIIIPGSLPDILVGARLAIGAGWMSVMWAEFIATSSGLGFSLLRAQQSMETNLLMGLMLLAAFLGFTIDHLLVLFTKLLVRWKEEE